ncbi:putative plus-end-directed kinesin ATPase [Dioscorea sansibarensis]
MGSLPATISGDSVEHKSPHLPHRRGVRVVGKIGPIIDKDPSLLNHSQVSVVKADGGHAMISFTDHSASRNESYKLDWCYEQDERIDQIFSKEIKPLLYGVLRGSNACVLGYGARRSGKTHTIQGSEENPGLAPMAVFELLALVEESGGGSVSISCYEVNQDHIYDVLELKEQEVLVLEDAGRRIQLKGLSRVPVKSVSDFKRMYFNRRNSDAQLRSHKGLIIYVATVDKETNTNYLGKMNFIDLAGYEDVKRISDPKPHLSESAKINKSLFQLLNVVYALNANEMYVPYRESKLTRLIQDFMCKSSGAVLLTCLSPVLCQDTAHVVSMASRSCQVVNQYRHDSSRKHKSSLWQGLPCSPSAGRTGSINSSTKKNENLHFGSMEKKGNNATPMTKKGIGCTPAAYGSSVRKVRHFQPGSVEKDAKDMPLRKLFDAASRITGSIQDEVLIVSEAVEHSSQEEVECISQVVEHSSSDEAALISNTIQELDIVDVVPAIEPSGMQNIHETAISDSHDDLKKDNSKIGESSPPLSERIREISNSLRLLSCQPLSMNTPQPDVSFAKRKNVDHMDPKTPVPFNLNLDENSTFGNTFTPQDRLRTRSTGLKKSLVHECLAFLNSANKEELKSLKGIGEKRASHIVQLRETETEPFKDVDDIRALGLSSRQVEDMITSVLGAI